MFFNDSLNAFLLLEMMKMGFDKYCLKGIDDLHLVLRAIKAHTHKHNVKPRETHQICVSVKYVSCVCVRVYARLSLPSVTENTSTNQSEPKSFLK